MGLFLLWLLPLSIACAYLWYLITLSLIMQCVLHLTLFLRGIIHHCLSLLRGIIHLCLSPLEHLILLSLRHHTHRAHTAHPLPCHHTAYHVKLAGIILPLVLTFIPQYGSPSPTVGPGTIPFIWSFLNSTMSCIHVKLAGIILPLVITFITQYGSPSPTVGPGPIPFIWSFLNSTMSCVTSILANIILQITNLYTIQLEILTSWLTPPTPTQHMVWPSAGDWLLGLSPATFPPHMPPSTLHPPSRGAHPVMTYEVVGNQGDNHPPNQDTMTLGILVTIVMVLRTLRVILLTPSLSRHIIPSLFLQGMNPHGNVALRTFKRLCRMTRHTLTFGYRVTQSALSLYFHSRALLLLLYYKLRPPEGSIYTSTKRGSPSSPAAWYLDGCSDFHVAADLDSLINVKKNPVTCHTVNGPIQSDLEGTALLRLKTSKGQIITLTLPGVRYIPGNGKNLISEGLLHNSGIILTEGKSAVKIRTTENSASRTSYVQTKREGNLWFLITTPAAPEINLTQKSASQRWLTHLRLGHASDKYVDKLDPSSLGGSRPDPKTRTTQDCKCCRFSKATRPHFPSSNEPPPSERGEIAHSDVWGPFRVPFVMDRSIYCIHFTDGYSKYSRCFFMTTKDQVYDKFKLYHAYCKSLDITIRTLRCDNAMEYNSHLMEDYCSNNNIRIQNSAPYCHESNGTAERVWRTICETTQALLIGSRLPLSFWGFAMRHAFWLKNRLPHSSLPGFTTPHNLWHKKHPNLANTKIFGCTTYVFNDVSKRQDAGGKLIAPKSWRGIYIGHQDDGYGYQIFDPASGNLKGVKQENMIHKFIEEPDEFGILKPFDESLLHPPSPDEVQITADDGLIQISHLTEVDDYEDILNYGTYKDPKTSITHAVAQLKIRDSPHLHWVTLTTLLGVGRTGLAATLYRRVSAHLKNPAHRPTNITTLLERQECLLEDHNGKNKKYSCIISATNFTREDGRFYFVIFTDGASMWLGPGDFTNPPTLPNIINAIFGNNWTFSNKRFQNLDQKFGPHDVDACCDEEGSNSLLPTHWSDALHMSWERLNVWCNPPYDKIELFLQKFFTEQEKSPYDTTATFILPMWKTTKWWHLTYKLDLVEVIPKGSKIFTSDYRNPLVWDGPTRWDVGVFRSKHTNTIFSTLMPAINLIHQHVYSTVANIPLPKSARDALSGAQAREWGAALDSEKASLRDKGVYDKVLLPPNRKALKSKIVFKIKEKKVGDSWVVDRYKCRWVCCGYSQRPGLDFAETFAPVVGLTSVRILICIIVQMGLTPFQYDISTAFLYADLTEEIYVSMPDGLKEYAPDGQEYVWRLKKSLYGLKQAPREWHSLISKWLVEYGFQPSPVDSGIYTYRKNGIFCIIGLYVDDIIGGSTSPEFIAGLYSSLSARFDITRSEKVNSILGIELDHKENGAILLHQTKYIEDLLAEHGMSDCMPKHVPMDPEFEISSHDCPATPGEKRDMASKAETYQSLIGALLWISRCCHPEISAAVTILCRYTHNPSQRHLNAAMHVLQYLKHAKGYGLLYKKASNPTYQLHAFVDANWAGDLDTRHSTSGLVSVFCGCVISWVSQKQTIVATSTTEAEYVALSSMSKEILFLRNLLDSIGFPQKTSKIHADNMAANFLTEHAKVSTRTKHIDIKYHHIRELVETKQVAVDHVDTKYNISDIATKPLSKVRFYELLKLFMYPIKSL